MRVLILLENLPLQRDARVTRQCRALLASGHDVTVICPASDLPMPRQLEGVRVCTYRAREGAGVAAFLVEYGWAVAAMFVLTLREFCSTRRFDVIQTCNPPDLLFLVAAPYRLVGRPFVFDHHDLVPELFEVRYGNAHPSLDRAVRFTEQASLRLASRILATNDSVRRVALERGHRQPVDVRVVRNGPELDRLPAPRRDPAVGRPRAAVWVGVMGPYDGVDTIIEALAIAVHGLGREDVRVVLVGDGEVRADVERLIDRLEVRAYVTLTGWIPQDEVAAYLADADVGLAPDPPGPRSDRATMMKVMDYMAVGLPVLAFDVHETKTSAGGAGIHVDAHDPRAYAHALVELLDDDERRLEMGAIGRRRVEEELSWDIQQHAYLAAIEGTQTGRHARAAKATALAATVVVSALLAGRCRQ